MAKRHLQSSNGHEGNSNYIFFYTNCKLLRRNKDPSKGKHESFWLLTQPSSDGFLHSQVLTRRAEHLTLFLNLQTCVSARLLAPGAQLGSLREGTKAMTHYVRWRFTAALIPQLFGNSITPQGSHQHANGGKGRVPTGDRGHPVRVLCLCQPGQDISN